MNQPKKQCANCAHFVFKSKQWGDCIHTGVPIRLQGKQHKDNGATCPGFKLREVQA